MGIGRRQSIVANSYRYKGHFDVVSNDGQITSLTNKGFRGQLVKFGEGDVVELELQASAM